MPVGFGCGRGSQLDAEMAGGGGGYAVSHACFAARFGKTDEKNCGPPQTSRYIWYFIWYDLWGEHIAKATVPYEKRHFEGVLP